jgi:hypothetical protein
MYDQTFPITGDDTTVWALADEETLGQKVLATA